MNFKALSLAREVLGCGPVRVSFGERLASFLFCPVSGFVMALAFRLSDPIAIRL